MLPPGCDHVDKIDINIKMARRLNEVTKVSFLSKIQTSLTNQLEAKEKRRIRAEQNQSQK